MPHRNRNDTIPPFVGFIFIFNLIVGTGALTLPAVFAKAGWILSLIIVILLAFISYMTVTFVIETIACANAIKNWQNYQLQNESDEVYNESNPTSLLLPPPITRRSIAQTGATVTANSFNSSSGEVSQHEQNETTNLFYNLNEKFELGEIAALFFNDAGRIIFYVCMAIYLYGDLSIYSAAIAKSLCDTLCDAGNGSISFNFGHRLLGDNDNMTVQCWNDKTMTRQSVYRLFLIAFTTMFGPFILFTVQKTKYIQILTVLFRWLAFIFMIAFSTKILLYDGVRGHPATVNMNGLPALFGACVYSFMCHHSLPSLLSPISNKNKLHTIISWDFIVICTFYIILALTGIFAFEHLHDLYTLNFIPQSTNDHNHGFLIEFLIIIDYFLALFPVFTLSASFPIIAITLRNNLQILFLDMTRIDSYSFFVRRLLFPICTVIPPFVITFFTENLTSLVTFTGTYAGAGIQYFIPIALLYFARRTCLELLGNGVVNDFRSPFRHNAWLVFVLLWSVTCIFLVTVNFFLNPKTSV